MCSLIYRSWYRRRSEGSHASGDAELSKTPLGAWVRGCCRCSDSYCVSIITEV